MKEKRRHTRYLVDIPCKVSWKDAGLEAKITDLSYGGAKLTEATAIPPKDAMVTIAFEFDNTQVQLDGLLTSRVVYSVTRALAEDQAGFFGVEFQESPKEIQEKLSAIFKALETRPAEVAWQLVNPLGRCKYCGRWSSMVCRTCDEAPYVCDDCTTKHLETHLSR